MSSCSKHKKGNLFSGHLPHDGPYTASVDQVCRDDEGNTQTRYSSFSSNVRPEDPRAVTRALESHVKETRPATTSLLGNVANVFKSVFGPSNSSNTSNNNRVIPNQLQPQNVTSTDTKARTEPFVIQDQNWPTPHDDEEEDGQKGASRKPERKPRVKKSKSVKKRKSIVHRRSSRKKSKRVATKQR